MTHQYVFIHGLWSSPNSFNYIKDKLGVAETAIDICYTKDSKSITNVVNDVEKILDGFEVDNVRIVGHSLGGLIALGLAELDIVDSIITIASPIGGIKMNFFAQQMISFYSPIIQDAFHNSDYISSLKKKEYNKPIYHIVANSGYSPFISEKSDGVVTIDSQTNWKTKYSLFHFIEANHHEILQHNDTIESMKRV